MPRRNAHAEWNGDLLSGSGRMNFGSGAFEGAYSFSSRFENGSGTNPEELIAAAHAGCFSMAFSADLAAAGHKPVSVKTDAGVYIEKTGGGFSITRIELRTIADVPGIDNADFQKIAEGAKKNCPVSRALAAVEIDLEAKLV